MRAFTESNIKTLQRVLSEAEQISSEQILHKIMTDVIPKEMLIKDPKKAKVAEFMMLEMVSAEHGKTKRYISIVIGEHFRAACLKSLIKPEHLIMAQKHCYKILENAVGSRWEHSE